MYRPLPLLALCLLGCVTDFPATVALLPDGGRRDSFTFPDTALPDAAPPDAALPDAQPDAAPRDELCNGSDDDFDGRIDEQVPVEACPKQRGVCRGARAPCLGQAGYGTCRYLEAMPAYEPDERTCDQADNDCDGTIDEGCDCMPGDSRVCGVDLGACQTGRQLCIDGRYGPCTGAIEPAPETCDGTDEDCNGVIDDVPVQACDTGQSGVCQVGVSRCDGGQESCARVFEPSEVDRCTGEDDDCDGDVDEDALTGACDTGQLGVCATGRQLCVAGAPRCTQNDAPSAEILDGLDNDCDGQVDERPPPDALDLADLVVGGDGSRPGRPAQRIELAGALRPGGFQSAPVPFLDGAFSPSPEGVTPIDSANTLFDFSPETGVAEAGQPLGKGPQPAWNDQPDLPDYAQPEHSLIELRANSGLTFDLEAIRDAYRHPPRRLTLRFGNLGEAPVIAMVLIDAASWRRINVVQGAERSVNLPLNAGARRLSIAIMTAEGPFADQRSYVGDPRLHFIAEEDEP